MLRNKLKLLVLITISLFLWLSFLGKKQTSAQSRLTLGQWQETAAFVDSSHHSHPLPSFSIGNYYYVHTKTKEGKEDRVLYFARQNADGSLTAWQVANSDHGGGPHGYTAVSVGNTAYHFRNGHIIQYVAAENGLISQLKQVERGDGNGFPSGIRYMWDTAVFTPFANQKYIYHLGGFNMNGHAYNTNKLTRIKLPVPDSNASFEEVGTVPTNNPNKAAFYRPEGASYGFIFMGVRGSSALKRLQIFEDGRIGEWLDVTELPAGSGNNLGDLFVIGDQLFAVRGKKVFQATINQETGALSAWDDLPPDLPTEQIDVNWNISNTEGASYGIIGNYIYLTGQNKVYYAQIINSSDTTSTLTPPLNLTPTQPPIQTPTPTDMPSTVCNGLVADTTFNFSFRLDKVVNEDNFNLAGGLSIIAYNINKYCILTFDHQAVTRITGYEFDFKLKGPINLPSGNYIFILSGPRNLKQVFNSINLTTTNQLDCTNINASLPLACGEFSDAQNRQRRVLFSGDANQDNKINLLDFELYRQKVGLTDQDNNVDFDYNGKIEFGTGLNDDLVILTRNFGKSGV